MRQGTILEHTRSSFYSRQVLTQYQLIANPHVPKLRRGNAQFASQIITRCELCWGPLLDQQLMGYCLGLSLRELQESMPQTLGEVLAPAALEGQVTASKTARLPALLPSCSSTVSD